MLDVEKDVKLGVGSILYESMLLLAMIGDRTVLVPC